MNEIEFIPYQITLQGAITINHCVEYIKTDEIVAFSIDTENKYGEISATGSNENNIPCMVLEAMENTTNIKKGKKLDDLTEIEFPDFAGWDVFCCSWSKYTIYVCMINLKK